MAGAGGSSVETAVDAPADSQFAPTTKSTDGSTAIAVSDSEFTTPTTCTASSSATTITPLEENPSANDGNLIQSGGITRIGMELATGHTLVGKTLRTATVYVKKDSGTPTGTARIKVYDSGGTLKATSTESLDVSTLTTTETAFLGTFSGGIVIANGDRIMFECDGIAGGILTVVYASSDTIANASVKFYDGSWTNSTKDFKHLSTYDLVYDVTSMKDNKSNPTALRHKSNSEVAPWVKADMASAVEMLGVAVHFHADTDITSFKIETSADDSTYIRRKTIPYTLITEGAWTIILFPRPPLACRYLKITGLDAGAKTISVNEIAVLVLTESVINRRHRIVEYTPTSNCLTLTGA